MRNDKSVKEQLQEELDQRIAEIESPEYEYVERLNKADYLGMAITAAVCITIIIIGIV